MTKHSTAWIKIKRGLGSFAGGEEGTQLIEFAIALPFLVLMFAGAVELGRLFYTYTTLTKATVVGARYLSAPAISALGSSGYDPQDIAAAKNLMICGVAASCSGQPSIVNGLGTGNISITAPPDVVGVRYVTVTINYTYAPKVFNLAGLTGVSQLSLNYSLTPQTTMRYLRDTE